MEELLNVTAVEVTGDHRLRLGFEDGTVGDVDFTDRAWTGVFERHADPRYFARVAVDPELGTITWPDGTDMAPETLLDEARRNPAPVGSIGWEGREPVPEAPRSSVPRLSSFYGITISMYWDEASHRRPHFHAQYAGQQASVDLAGGVIVGSLPPRALVLVRDWCAIHAEELAANWDRARDGRPLRPIAPLA